MSAAHRGALIAGQPLVTANGRRGVVGALLGSGGQGEVYHATVEGLPLTLKWYHAHYIAVDTALRTRLERAVRTVFDLRPAAIIRDLQLRQPMYSPTAAYGHFGRGHEKGSYVDPELRPKRVEFFTWERTARVRDLLTAVKG